MRNRFFTIRLCVLTCCNPTYSDFSNKLNSFQNQPCDVRDVSADGAKVKAMQCTWKLIFPTLVQTLFQLEFIEPTKEKKHDKMNTTFVTNDQHI